MTLSRRNVLKGAAGLSLFLPTLESLGQTTAPPKRIVFVFTANGDQIAQRFTTRGETNWVFADMLTPRDLTPRPIVYPTRKPSTRTLSEYRCKRGVPRRRADSNRCTRLCRPLPNLSATAPRGSS